MSQEPRSGENYFTQLRNSRPVETPDLPAGCAARPGAAYDEIVVTADEATPSDIARAAFVAGFMAAREHYGDVTMYGDVHGAECDAVKSRDCSCSCDESAERREALNFFYLQPTERSFDQTSVLTKQDDEDDADGAYEDAYGDGFDR